MFSLNKDFTNSKFNLGFFTITNFLSNEEIDLIHKEANRRLKVRGAVGSENSEIPSFLHYSEKNLNHENPIRDSNVIWLEPAKNEFLIGIYKKIFKTIVEVNENEFQFNLTDVEPFQYTMYDEDQYYGKHIDSSPETMAGNLIRKLSFSIQLSDPLEYEGGNLCCYVTKEPVVACREKGCITFFPSFVLHDVTPITKGKRRSLVGWIHGPKFI